jgi:hypothetical protein
MKTLAFISFLILSLNLFSQTSHRYYSFNTIAGNENYPNDIQTVKENVTILLNEETHKIDIYFSDGRHPILLEYALIDAKPEAVCYRLYKNDWGWASLIFSSDNTGLSMSCIPINKNSLTIIYGPLTK